MQLYITQRSKSSRERNFFQPQNAAQQMKLKKTTNLLAVFTLPCTSHKVAEQAVKEMDGWAVSTVERPFHSAHKMIVGHFVDNFFQNWLHGTDKLKSTTRGKNQNKQTSTLHCQNVRLRQQKLTGLVMTLTSDLSPWKPFQQCSLTWWIFVASFTEIRRTKYRDIASGEISIINRRTDGRPTGKHYASAACC